MSSSLTGLLDGSTKYLGSTVALGAPEAMVEELERAGWRVWASSRPPRVAPTSIGRSPSALDFGDYFGQNLDALWDCLTDLTRPTALVLSRWTTFAQARPQAWPAILDVLRDRSR